VNVLLLKAWLEENACLLTGARLREVRQVDVKSFALRLDTALGQKPTTNAGGGGLGPPKFGWLLLSILEAYPTVALIDDTEANRETPESGFVKSLNHHLSGAALVSVTQQGFDRSVVLAFSRRDVYGRETQRSLRVELVGRASNAYLLNEKGVVISIFKHVPPGRNSVRRVTTGRPLPDPPPLGKYVASEANIAELEAALVKATEDNASEPIRELLTRHVAGGDVHLWPSLQVLYPAEASGVDLREFVANLQSGNLNGQLFGLDNRSANAVTLDKWRQASSPSNSKAERLPQMEVDPRRAQIMAQLELAQKAEELEESGLEMLRRARGFDSREKETAFLRGWLLSHPDWAERIDIAKSAEDNAGALIEYSQRLKRARPKLAALVKLPIVSPAGEGKTVADAAARQGQRKDKPDQLARDLSKLERSGVKYLRYATSDGVPILVGQSDRSNDELVRHYGSSRHLWFHVRDYSGSHVLLLTNGQDVPQRSIEEAGIIAGYYSKGRGETDLDISYTPVKQLRRPRGGKPGQVLLVSEKVIRVNPMRFETLREELRISSTSQ
jgi:hypothetical protein